MSENRISIGAAVGLGMATLLWLMWAGSAVPLAPALSPAPNEPEISLTTTTIDQGVLGSAAVSRELIFERAPQQIQVVDARTMQPVQGASVVFKYDSDFSSRTMDSKQLQRLLRLVEATESGDSSTVLGVKMKSYRRTFQFGSPIFSVDRRPRSAVSDSNGMVKYGADSKLVRLLASRGTSSGSAEITTHTTSTQILIEPPITIRALDTQGEFASSYDVVTFLCADEEWKGPIHPIPKADGTVILNSPWKELRIWIGDRPYKRVGILIGFASDPDWFGAWLPIEAPVPSLVTVQSPPSATRDVKGR